LQAAGSNTPCVIRLSSGDEVPVKKALDIGAAGIIAPQINTAEDARRVVQLAKYAPTGTRGVGIARAHQYGAGFQEYVEAANDNLAVIVQAEHVEAVRNIESIVRVEGVDAVLIGPYDLSASLGKPGQVRDPEVTSAIDHVTRVCQNAGLRLGIFGISAEAVKPYVERGYTLVVVGVDTMMLVQGAGKIVSDFKG
jgi:2-dehydro-3-deoxyglucarate aldolase